MFVPLAHPPGHAQADFGEAVVVIGGIEQKAHFFVMDLPHSDACFVRAYPAATAEAWVDGHVHAFAFFGKVPVPVLYDSKEDQETIRGIVSPTTRCLVAKILPDGTRQRATLFEPGACQIACSVTLRATRQGKRQGQCGRPGRLLAPQLHGADPAVCDLGRVQRLPGGAVCQTSGGCPARPVRDHRSTPRAGSGCDVRLSCGNMTNSPANTPWHAPDIWGAHAPWRLTARRHWPGFAPPRGRFLLRR